ncbi:MAG: hypothetical protein B6240_01955 [Desulfobacteraceae bacterium 4572_87]|nr:MAG: hypothetical protein B6240_01955 [Desulfobacteraceae bacterium 4572_87]
MPFERINRGYRAINLMGKAGKVATRHGLGRAGSKVALKVISKAEIITAVADAVISVAEAAGLYFQLEAEREKTNRLNMMIQVERKRLQTENEKLRMLVQTETKRLKENREMNEIGYQMIKNISKIIKKFEPVLKEAKESIQNGHRTPEVLNRYYAMESRYEIAIQKFYDLQEILDQQQDV